MHFHGYPNTYCLTEETYQNKCIKDLVHKIV